MTDKRVDKSEAQWRNELTSEQFTVCRKRGTERAFTGKYYDCKEDGVYQCSCCGIPLFSSETKYDSGSGWPSFYAPIKETQVRTRQDTSHGMQRLEVLCSSCEAHLGHVFPDGPEPTGLRFCINSVALKLDKEKNTDSL